MAKPLTQLRVDKLKPADKRLEVPDHIVRGLYLIVQPRSGVKSWALRYRSPIDGKPAKLTLPKAHAVGLKDARDWAREHLRDVAHGNDPRAEKRRAKASTLGAIIAKYDQHVVAGRRPRYQIEIRRHLSRDWQKLHHRPIAELKRADIADRLLELKAHGAVAANRSRSSLSAVFTWAIAQGLAESNPVVGTTKNKERSRARVLDNPLRLGPKYREFKELRAIWQATEDEGDYNAIVRIMMLTGQRREEVAAMTWSEFDLDRKLWVIPASRTKNSEEHTVPLSKQVVDILKSIPRRPDRDMVFGAGNGAFSGWSRCKARLDGLIARQRAEHRLGRTLKDGEKPEPGDQLLGWVLHDLRRSFSTHLVELNVAPHIVENCTNHVSGHRSSVAGVYNRSRTFPECARAMQMWADTLLGEAASTVVDFPTAARSA